MSVRTLSIHSVTIQRDEGTNDQAGGYAHAWVSDLVNVPCRIQPLSAREQERWAGRPVIATHTLYFPDTGLEFSEDARILFGSRAFDVLGVRDIDELGSLSAPLAFLTVDVREIR